MINAFNEQYKAKTFVLTAEAGRSGSFEVTITTSTGETILVHSKVGGAGHVADEHLPKIMEALEAAF